LAWCQLAYRSEAPTLERIIPDVISGFISVTLGSVLGVLARYFVSGIVARRVGETFPYGTLLINVSGALVIGVLGGLAPEKNSLFADPDAWLFAVTGFLGAYTTVSSFSLQTLSLARDGEGGRAALYVVLSVALSLAAAALGFALVDALK
jgi:fluoride exporter